MMRKIKLYCFPYAGGSASLFSKWKPYLDPLIELKPIELAGRGRRIHEPVYNSVSELIDDVFNLIRDEIDDSPYVFFGHSMGGMIAYQLAQEIRKEHLLEPLHIFFSGRQAPHIKKDNEKLIHLLPEKEFIAKIITFGGTPAEFFNHPELMEVFMPVLKSDFKLAETDFSNNEINPLNCNITVFFGKDEGLTSEQCDTWKKHTSKICSIHYFNGGHFFINDQTKQIVKLINNTLVGNIYA